MIHPLAVALAFAGAVLVGPSGAHAAANGLIAFSVVQPVETCDQCGPDGNTEHVGGGSRIWLVRPDGTGRRKLPCTGARDGCRDRDPAFAPDGTRLAINGAHGLVVMTPGGRELLRVDPFPGWSPSWGPGGRRLAYVTAQTQPGDLEGRGIALTDLAGHDQMIISADAGSVAWSPRGPLAWTVFRRYPWSTLWVGDAAGHRRRAIVRRVDSPSWAPDALRIAFLAPRGLAVVDADGDRRRLLTHACGIGYQEESGVAWSPDGTAIACSGRGGSLVVLDLRTMTIRKVVPQRALGQGSVDGISWQPAPALGR
jgi:dipeptidyl aminopeptidase/acylaminoacyl peptidase